MASSMSQKKDQGSEWQHITTKIEQVKKKILIKKKEQQKKNMELKKLSNQERKSHNAEIKKFREFIDSFELPNKIKSRQLRVSNKHNIKNPNDFQYSLGLPKLVNCDSTRININGLKGEITLFTPTPPKYTNENSGSNNRARVNSLTLGLGFWGMKSVQVSKKRFGQSNTTHVFRRCDQKGIFPIPSLQNPFTLFQAGNDTTSVLTHRMTQFGLMVKQGSGNTTVCLTNFSNRKRLIKCKFKISPKDSEIITNKNNYKYKEQAHIHKFTSQEITLLCSTHHKTQKILLINSTINLKERKFSSINQKYDNATTLRRIEGTDQYAFLRHGLPNLAQVNLFNFNDYTVQEAASFEPFFQFGEQSSHIEMIYPQMIGKDNCHRLSKILNFNTTEGQIPEDINWYHDILAIMDAKFTPNSSQVGETCLGLLIKKKKKNISKGKHYIILLKVNKRMLNKFTRKFKPLNSVNC